MNRTLTALLLVAAAGMLLSGLDRDSAEVTARIVEERSAEVYALPMQHPLDCQATVTQRTYYHERGKTRCYSRQGEPK